MTTATTRRHAWVAAPLGVLALVATACGGDSDTTEEPADSAGGREDSGGSPATPGPAEECDPDGMTIRATFVEQGQVAAELAKETLESEYPGLTVELELSSAAGYDELTQQIVTDLAAGRQHDVIMVGLGQIRFWVDQYEPAPIDPDSLEPSYDRSFLSIGEVGGTPYVAPFQVSMPVLFTNTTLAEQAGVDEPPATTSELVEAARAVTETTEAAGAYLPQDRVADWPAQAYIQSAGATFVDEDGMPAFDTEQGAEGLSVYERLAADGLLEPVPVADAQSMFLTGQLAYMVYSPAAAAVFSDQIGDSFEWTVSDLPLPDGGSPVFPAGGNGWMVLSSDECRAAYASELIGAMLDPQVVADSARSYSYIPVDDAAAEELQSDPLADTPIGHAWDFDGDLTAWGGWHGDVTPQVNQILQEMVQRLSRGEAVDDVLPETVEQIEAVVGQ